MRNLKPFSLFVFFFAPACEFPPPPPPPPYRNTALKVEVLLDRKIYCLKARPCIFQPGKFTGWGSEGVNVISAKLSYLKYTRVLLQVVTSRSLSHRKYTRAFYLMSWSAEFCLTSNTHEHITYCRDHQNFVSSQIHANILLNVISRILSHLR